MRPSEAPRRRGRKMYRAQPRGDTRPTASGRQRQARSLPARRLLRTSTNCTGAASCDDCSAMAKQELARRRSARWEVVLWGLNTCARRRLFCGRSSRLAGRRQRVAGRRFQERAGECRDLDGEGGVPRTARRGQVGVGPPRFAFRRPPAGVGSVWRSPTRTRKRDRYAATEFGPGDARRVGHGCVGGSVPPLPAAPESPSA
jgi:hypothetical protein